MAKKHVREPGNPSSQLAVVAQVFPEDGYGFLLTDDDRELRFDRESVLRDEFDELRVGSEVSYAELPDATEPTAGMVDLQSVPLPPADGVDEQLGADDEVPEMPDQWQEK